MMTRTKTARRTASVSPFSLVEIGLQLRRDARATPGAAVERPLANGATLTYKYDPTARRWFLRVARKGLSPLNDFSLPSETRLGGAARLKRWYGEIKIFRRDLNVPEDAKQYDGAAELMYWVDLSWSEKL